MLKPDQPLAIYMAGALGEHDGKMGHGVLRYAPYPIACVVDATKAGKRVRDVIDLPRDCPVVASVDEAAALGATALLLGIAPLGGRIPEAWLADIDRAVALGLGVVNGLHERLAPRYAKLQPGQVVWDVRREPPGLTSGTGAAATLNNRRILLVGTDMNLGKMTAALEMHRLAEERGLKAAFVATGQIGIVIRGAGVPLDAVRLDFAAGAIEQCVMAEREADLIFVEGQGSILHPASSATLPLLRGSCPTHLILCHRGGQEYMRMMPDRRVPDLLAVARLYEDMAAACGLFARPKTVGIALNTVARTPAEAAADVARTAAETGLPTTDVVRFGPAPLLDAILAN